MRTGTSAWLAASLAALAVPLQAQEAPKSSAPAPTAAESDIVIEGYRDRKDLNTFVKYPTAISTIKSRMIYDAAERTAKCAARSNLSDHGWLRRVVDGEINSARHAFAQNRLTRLYATCGTGSAGLLRLTAGSSELEAYSGYTDTTGATPGIDAFPLGRSVLDRGAYTVQVIKRFAPDLELTAAETHDPAVQARYALREGARNRYRYPADQTYFRVASCMVKEQPALAVRLAKSDGEARFGDVQAALIDRANVCVGGIKDVQVDPSQFRAYIADAVYRWAVAARNVASLIPPDAPRAG